MCRNTGRRGAVLRLEKSLVGSGSAGMQTNTLFWKWEAITSGRKRTSRCFSDDPEPFLHILKVSIAVIHIKNPELILLFVGDFLIGYIIVGVKHDRNLVHLVSTGQLQDGRGKDFPWKYFRVDDHYLDTVEEF